MKKQYTAPKVNVVKVNSSEMICVSTGFGDGDTPVMHAKQRDIFVDEEDNDLWDEQCD